MTVAESVKYVVDNLRPMISPLVEMLGMPDSTVTAVRIEIGKFLMYLSAADGNIGWDEAKIISGVFERNLTPNDVAMFIEANNIYSTEFERKVPVTFQAVVNGELLLRKNGYDLAISETMLSAYEVVGKCLVSRAGNVNTNQMTDYKIYIDMLKKYRYTMLNGTGGLTKNDGSVQVPPKK